MENLPLYINFVFIFTTGLAIWFLYQATNHSKSAMIMAILWLTGQGTIALSGFYTVTSTLPPRMLLLILPPLLLIFILFFSSRGRQFIDKQNIKVLTLLHLIRVPVELVLFVLFINQVVPNIMTFEGRNLDILAGLTAPIIFYFRWKKKILGSKILLAWNFLCLGLLVNIVTHGILSVPGPFQRFGFDQPNIALLHFPFVWLPGFIVPLVLFAHLACIHQLLNKQGKQAIEQALPQL